MVLNISESGVLLDGSAKAMAGLPAQAFAISLSGSVIEDMIACVQNGGDIQLALGSNPVSIELPAPHFSAIVSY
jgi:RNA polymerase II elongation factor ELL